MEKAIDFIFGIISAFGFGKSPDNKVTIFIRNDSFYLL